MRTISLLTMFACNTTPIKEKETGAIEQDREDEIAAIIGVWRCDKMDGETTPLNVNPEDPEFNHLENVASIEKDMFLIVNEDFSGELNSEFRYTFVNGETEAMTAPLPMSMTADPPTILSNLKRAMGRR